MAEGWQSRKHVLALTLNTSGAFDYVSRERLLHNMKRRRLSGKWANWIRAFVKQSCTLLQLPDNTTPLTKLTVRIPQGSPLYLPLFIIFQCRPRRGYLYRRHDSHRLDSRRNSNRLWRHRVEHSVKAAGSSGKVRRLGRKTSRTFRTGRFSTLPFVAPQNALYH